MVRYKYYIYRTNISVENKTGIKIKKINTAGNLLFSYIYSSFK